LPEILASIAVLAVLAALLIAVLPAIGRQADRTDALAKVRTMGQAVLHYATDHGGRLPALFPGQVLEYEAGRGGRIVTECAAYLGLKEPPGKFLAEALMPRAYARLKSPADHNTMRVFVMNTAVTNGPVTLAPFGTVLTGGQPPVGALTLASLGGSSDLWMMATADRLHPNVSAAPWKANAPAAPPLGGQRAIFQFDGSTALEKVSGQ
jgi:hypothetical protein